MFNPHVTEKGTSSFCDMITFCAFMYLSSWVYFFYMFLQCSFWMPTIIAQITMEDISAMLISDMFLQVLISIRNIIAFVTFEHLWSMFRFNMHSESLFGAFIITRLAKMSFLLLMSSFHVLLQVCLKVCLVIPFFTRICDSKVNSGVHLKFMFISSGSIWATFQFF